MDNNKSFCSFFWSQIHVDQQSGNVKPCCISHNEMSLGNINDQTIDELWNAPLLQELRSKALKGEEIKGCEKCTKLDQSGQESLRTYANDNMSPQVKEWVAATDENGKCPSSKPTTWDIRFSNVCNFKCRICNGLLSSKWFDDEKKLGINEYPNAIRKSIKDINKFMLDFEQYVPHMDSIYFAGGEPLITDEHYLVLNEIIKHEVKPSVIYNTNLSTFTHRKSSILDIWSTLGDKLTIQASLDGSGARAEYMRSGTVWSQIESNLRELKDRCKDAKLIINPTLSIYNAFHLPDFHREMVDKGFISVTQWQINYLQDPYYQNAKNLLDTDKKELFDKYTKHIDWIYSHGDSDDIKSIAEQFKTSIKFFFEEVEANQHSEFLDKTRDLDKIRKERFSDIFPELHNFWLTISLS